MEKTIDKIYNYLVDSGINLIEALLIVIIGFRLINVLIKLVRKGKFFNKLEKSVQSFALSFISVALKIVIIITACSVVGIPMTGLLALLSSAALAIGLSLQGSLSNLAGGLMILLFKPFKVGDYINTHTDEGTVLDITMFYTTLLTVDNREIVLPNGNLSNTTVINYSKMPKRRVDLTFTTSYNNDIDKVKDVLNEVADKNDLIFKEDRVIRLLKHGDSSLEFAFKVWCKTEDYWTVYFDMMENVKKAFDKNKIEIPYPQLDVHLDK